MRPEKQLLLDEMKGKIEGSTALILTRYQHLSPNLASELRSKLMQSGGGISVVKKRILLKAAETLGVSIANIDLEGHIGVVYAHSDPIPVTKALFDFRQANQDLFEVVCGRYEGQLISGAQIEVLSKLPGKNELRAQLLAVLEAPLSQTLAVMEALLASVVYCLDNKSQLNG